MKNKNVLYLSYDGMTDSLGQSQVIPYLVGLSEKGFCITIISFDKKQRYKEGKEFVSSLLNKSDIKWHSLRYTKFPPVLSTIWDIYQLYCKVKKLQHEESFDIVHCRGYITAFIGLWLKKKKKLKFVFDMRGFFADERVEGGLWSLKNPIFKKVYSFFKKQEIEFFKNADFIVSLTEKGKKIINQLEALNKNKLNIEVIPCCADLNVFDYQNIDITIKNKYKALWGVNEGEIILSYVGSVGTWYMLDEMFDFYKVASKSVPLRFLFINKEDRALIMDKAMEKGIDADKIIVQPAERAELPFMLSISQLSVFFIKPVYSKQASSPTKMAELMGMGIPIICNGGVGDVDSIMQNTGCGVVVEKFNTSEYERITTLIPDIMALDKEKIRNGAFQYYALSDGIDKYAQIYNQL